MTGTELLEALAQTGTGARKLEHIERLCERSKDMAGDAAALTEELAQTPGFPEGTVDKARRLLAGARPKDLNGEPPPNSRQAAERRLAKEVGVEVAKALAVDPAIARIDRDLQSDPDPRIAKALREKAAGVREELAGRQHEGQAAAQAAGVGNPEAMAKGKKK